MRASSDETYSMTVSPCRADFDQVIEKVRGAAYICSSLSISAEVGRNRYAGEGMALLYDILDTVVCDFERLLA